MNTSDRGATAPTQGEIDAFQRATRDLIGVALHSLEILQGEVSLPQFRLMLSLHDLGRSPSSQVAHALGASNSSVTRLADRLHGSGHVERGTDPRSRSVVTLELTARGHRVVDKVLEWRHHELARILAGLGADQRAATVDGLAQFHRVVGEQYTAELHGPVPL
ncbi:MarR family winged helix-turn-helix transcriptional regulator [Rhodococcus spelaei]|uniref:MarR family winged helix-turn-helix transcriptional regulator n=1 Tax=Rhodococcus spelaei TaxID=2546320 RepID=UPI001FEB8DB8|nr:MarR family transcriptional regulator [Rhodococcus spelaei]